MEVKYIIIRDGKKIELTYEEALDFCGKMGDMLRKKEGKLAMTENKCEVEIVHRVYPYENETHIFYYANEKGETFTDKSATQGFWENDVTKEAFEFDGKQTMTKIA